MGTSNNDYWGLCQHFYYRDSHGPGWAVRDDANDRVVASGLDKNDAAAVACLLNGERDRAKAFLLAGGDAETWIPSGAGEIGLAGTSFSVKCVPDERVFVVLIDGAPTSEVFPAMEEAQLRVKALLGWR